MGRHRGKIAVLDGLTSGSLLALGAGWWLRSALGARGATTAAIAGGRLKPWPVLEEDRHERHSQLPLVSAACESLLAFAVDLLGALDGP